MNMASEGAEEVSRCQLSGCDLVLLTTPLGLRLHWLSHTGGEVLGTAVVTSQECSGKLYPVLMDLKLEMAVFGREITIDPKATVSQGTPTCALVACKSGLVAAVHWKMPELCVNVCHSVQPVVWTGVMKANSCVYTVAVVDTGGTLSIGTASSPTLIQTNTGGKQILHWHTNTLPASPVAFCGHTSSLIFSDGDNSWLGKLSITPQGSVDVEWHKMKYCGVIRIENESEDRVALLTCDGRKYHCRWDELKSRGEEGSKEDVNLVNRKGGETLEGVMMGIQRCSKLLSTEGKEIATLDLYIKQLSLAQRLVHERETAIFSSSVKVEHSLEKRGSYIAIVHLQKLRNDIELDGKWWKLMVVTQESKENNYLSLKVDEESLKSALCFTIPLSSPDIQNFPQDITLQIFLILEHLTAATPVCQIFASDITIDAVDFLTPERVLGTKKLLDQCSDLDFHKIQKDTIFRASKVVTDKRSKPLPPCKVSMSFDASDENLRLLKSVLNPNKHINVEDIDITDHKTTLFHEEGRVDIRCRVNKDYVSVTLEGTNPIVVLSVRWALERRVLELKSNHKETTLSPAVLKKAHYVQRVVRFEASEASGLASLAHLHNTTSNLLSHLPLS